MLNTPFPPWPNFTPDECAAVSQVLASNRVNYWTGQEARSFEEEFAAWCGVGRAIALANGTLALELALRGLGIGPGDEVVVTPRSFIASVSSVVMVGATPVFADVDAASQNLTPQTVGAVLSSRTKAVICVHLAGWPVDMPSMRALAEEHGLALIEDCAQAHGAAIDGKPVGGWGDVAAWSFCQDKIMSTGGEGGLVTCDDEALWRRMWAFKDHGKSYAAVYEREHPPGYRWLHESFGSNYRMTEMQAAIGRIQLRRMPQWQAQRSENALRLAAGLRGIDGIEVPMPDANLTHAWYKFYCRVQPQRLAPGWDRDRIIQAIVERGVPCFSGSCSEIYLERAFDGTPYRPASPLPVAKAWGEEALMFLVHPTLDRSHMDRCLETVKEVMALAVGGGG